MGTEGGKPAADMMETVSISTVWKPMDNVKEKADALRKYGIVMLKLPKDRMRDDVAPKGKMFLAVMIYFRDHDPHIFEITKLIDKDATQEVIEETRCELLDSLREWIERENVKDANAGSFLSNAIETENGAKPL